MTLLQMQNFVLAANEKSFGKAASILLTSQPALSKQIAGLEEELNCKLFYRSAKGLELTENGRLYYDVFSEFLSSLSKVTHAIEEKSAAEQSGQITVYYSDDWNLTTMFPFAKQYIKTHAPTYTIVFKSIPVGSVPSFICPPNAYLITEAHLIDHPFFAEHYYLKNLGSINGKLIYSKDHLSEPSDTPTVSSFKEQPLYYCRSPWNEDESAGSRYRQELLGYKPKLSCQENLSDIFSAISTQGGYTLVHPFCPIIAYPNFSSIPIGLSMDVGLFWSRDQNPPLTNLLSDCLAEYINTHLS